MDTMMIVEPIRKMMACSRKKKKANKKSKHWNKKETETSKENGTNGSDQSDESIDSNESNYVTANEELSENQNEENSAMDRIILLTFNVGKNLPPNYEIRNKFKFNQTQAIVYAVSIQEIPNAEVYGVSGRDQSWYNFFVELMSDNQKSLIFHQYMTSNLLMIFGTSKFSKFIKKIETRLVPFTFYGLMGYKGTMGARLLLKNGVDLVFVTGHLTHGQENLAIRLKQYEQGKICTFDDAIDVASKRVIFWFGDLNFRASEDLTGQCREISDGKDLHLMNPRGDQLALCMKTKTAFKDFDEPPIRFPPSYKLLPSDWSAKFSIDKTMNLEFQRHRPKYDLTRIPSWCDRILINAQVLSFKNICYDIEDQIDLSDHYPVYAIYHIPDVFEQLARYT